MRTLVVVAVDPFVDDFRGFFKRRESVLPDAFALERFVISFHDAVLFGRVRVDEFLLETV